MILATHGIVGSQIGQYAYLLDDYSGAAAAYSLRKLRTAYTGSAIRVRRASDNTEQNIGFVNNQLDTSSLTSFCSGTNGFVTTWYDQSGNGRNATQTTAANQPQIVSSGSVITLNSKPSILFDGVNDTLTKTSFGFPTSNISISKVGNRISSSTNYDTFGYAKSTSVAAGGFINLNVSSKIGFDGRPSGSSYFSANSGLSPTNNQILQLNIYDGSDMKASANGNTFGTTAVSASPIIYDTQTLSIGSIIAFPSYSNCNTQELIIWDIDQTTNKSGIETNINDFYSIY